MGSAIPVAGGAISLGVLTLNWSTLSALPSAVLAQVVGAVSALLVLLAVAVLQPRGPSAPTRYPATEWPRPLSTENPRKGYGPYGRIDSVDSFLKVCDRLVDECVGELPWACELPADEVKWVRDMLNYNVKGGKMNRGLMVVACGDVMLDAKGIRVDSDMHTKLAVLGWCIEWLQAWLLIADDFMDDSQTRRGQLCWYKHSHVGKVAINDAFMLEMLVFRVLKRHFWQEPYYHQLVDLFMETTFQTECGQLLDLRCTSVALTDFTLERWTLIVKYKTAFYSFYCPIALGMIVAGIQDATAYHAAREPLIKMGIYFQAQDDFLDCFGTPEQIGKIGTDIQDKKCGWLFVHVYNRLASPEQKKFLEENYGRCRASSDQELEIKKMYKELKMEDLYNKYEQQSYDEIMAARPLVEAAGLPWSVFEVFLAKVYKRSK